MNTTVLFTKRPADYTAMLEKNQTHCTLITDENRLPEELSHHQPMVLLIEANEAIPTHLSVGDAKLENPFTPSAIVYAEKEILKKYLCEASRHSDSASPYEIPEQFNRKLDQALMEFQFSPSLRGYHYLKQAFYYEALNTRQISAVKKDIYEAISNCYCTSIYSVERGITFSIRKAYQKNPEKFRELFSSQTRAPSNMQFLKTFFIHLQQSGLF